MNRSPSAALLLLCLSAPVRAVDTAAGAGGAAFMNLGLGSARAMGMGRAYVALAEGIDALTWNPAGLALTQTREVGYSYLRYIQGVDAPLYMAYAHPLGRTVFGANIAYLSVDGFEIRDEAGKPRANDDVSVRDGFATLSMARSFWYEKVFLGGSLKTVREDNGGARRNTMAVDLGALFKPNNRVSFGFASQNLGGDQSRVAKLTRLGAALKLFDLLDMSLEASKPSDNAWKLGLGGEFILPEELLLVGQIAIRAGYYTTGNQGVILAEDRGALYPFVGAEGLSFGVGLFSSQAFGYGIGFEYALVPMGALGTADHLSLKVKF